MNIVLTVAYDGAEYAGWQRQTNGIAVQQRLEEVLSALLKQPVTVRASSRTDAGVHALGQRASFHTDELRIPMDKLPWVINGFLPADIAVTSAEIVAEDFNPRFAARQKTYRYQYYNAPCPNPLLRRYSAFVPQALDVAAMQKCAPLFTGQHDFKGFCAAGGCENKSTVRTIRDCALAQDGALLTLTVTGDAFLYNMVRIIAGTVLYVGLGKIKWDAIPDIIASQDRTRAGKTMPPEGLTLMEVVF